MYFVNLRTAILLLNVVSDRDFYVSIATNQFMTAALNKEINKSTFFLAVYNSNYKL